MSEKLRTLISSFLDKKAVAKAKKFCDILREWVKTWFYVLETEEEYKDSKNLLNQWIQEQLKNNAVTKDMVTAARAWLTSLEGKSIFCFHYVRLFTCGMNQRTTNSNEQLHHSIKSGFDGVKSSMSTTKSATNMVNKSNRTADTKNRRNAEQILKNKLYTVHDIQNHLTDYAAKDAFRQLSLKKYCKVVRIKEDLFYVLEDEEGWFELKIPEVVAKYSRVRVVEFIDNMYATCSCGYPARVKRPCAHIISVVGDISMTMYGLRWLTLYQFAFERDGQTKLTDHFRKMEAEEFNRNWDMGEHVLVEGLIPNLDERQLPCAYFNATAADIQTAIAIHRETFIKRNVVRFGSDIHLLVDKIDEDNRVGASTEHTSHEMDTNFDLNENIEVFYSQATQEMMDADNEAKVLLPGEVQALQQSAIDELATTPPIMYQEITAITSSTLSMIGRNRSVYNEYKKKLQEVHESILEKLNPPINTDNCEVADVYTGVSNKDKEARYKNY